jgi:hypothetical protein
VERNPSIVGNARRGVRLRGSHSLQRASDPHQERYCGCSPYSLNLVTVSWTWSRVLCSLSDFLTVWNIHQQSCSEAPRMREALEIVFTLDHVVICARLKHRYSRLFIARACDDYNSKWQRALPYIIQKREPIPAGQTHNLSAPGHTTDLSGS